MSEQAILFGFGTLTTALGAVSMVLIGWIVWELRQMRKELRECVPDHYCKALMGAHAERLKNLERK